MARTIIKRTHDPGGIAGIVPLGAIMVLDDAAPVPAGWEQLALPEGVELMSVDDASDALRGMGQALEQATASALEAGAGLAAFGDAVREAVTSGVALGAAFADAFAEVERAFAPEDEASAIGATHTHGVTHRHRVPGHQHVMSNEPAGQDLRVLTSGRARATGRLLPQSLSTPHRTMELCAERGITITLSRGTMALRVTPASRVTPIIRSAIIRHGAVIRGILVDRARQEQELREAERQQQERLREATEAAQRAMAERERARAQRPAAPPMPERLEQPTHRRITRVT